MLVPIVSALLAFQLPGLTSRRDLLVGFAAAATNVPMAAVAGSREDGIKLLRKQAASAKTGPPSNAKLWLGPPKGSGADKCQVSKPCTTGAGIKWDPVALGVAKGTYDPGKGGNANGANSARKFFKTTTYANSPY